jgi:nicotinamidase-related amidase
MSRLITGRIGFGIKPALLIIDMYNAITLKSSPAHIDLDEQIRQINRILEVTRPKNILTIFTTIAYEEGYLDGGVWVNKLPSVLKVMKMGSNEAQIDERLKPVEGEYTLVKKYASAFFGTPLASMLTSAGVDTVIVCGETTSGCVRASVVDAVSYGFRPIIPKECIGDREKGPHEANIYDMNLKYGDVVSIEEVLEYLQRYQV